MFLQPDGVFDNFLKSEFSGLKLSRTTFLIMSFGYERWDNDPGFGSEELDYFYDSILRPIPRVQPLGTRSD